MFNFSPSRVEPTMIFSSPGPSPSHGQLKRKRPSTPPDSSSSSIAQREIAYPSGTGGRTLKRWRNNRPNEETVHQYTLAKLFSAAKSVIPAVPKQQLQQSPLQQQPRPEKMEIQPTVQRSLFSVLGYDRRSSLALAKSAQSLTQMQCEDCDRAFCVPAADEDMAHCVGCLRAVCDVGCSTSNGEGRVCLDCARR